MKNNIKILRKAKGITQEELAKEVGISRQAMNAIENNRMSPNLIHAFKITFCLNQKYIEDVFLYED
ncbi:MAG: helix-turn-helix transcriptional regulator [Methanobrevibacter thaueri]|jgi:putative transcriptional regulator|uniref:helix-turn-helix transcriptional regulator n=1 Tax=Methanobrevibacter thaueri TaxID=190975 RepID=UPI0026EEBAFF|nr:helix-turn-helix transcriptional regulator [Methanobrevibacter thaueri]MBE6494990.1 helix-turn-helix transcriptional regulator [Methanobrevibacter thaueri]